MPPAPIAVPSLLACCPAPRQDAGVVVHFRNDSRAMHALEHAAVVVDRSHWGRLRLAGEGRLAFLHGQSTANLTALSPGQGCDTVSCRLHAGRGRARRHCVRGGMQAPAAVSHQMRSNTVHVRAALATMSARGTWLSLLLPLFSLLQVFVTPQGRCIDLATVYAQGSGALVLVSPGMATAVRQRLEKHLFPADKVRRGAARPPACQPALPLHLPCTWQAAVYLHSAAPQTTN